jgi:hypothetical protein
VSGHDLKKQSQFQNRQNGVKSVITMVYGAFDGPGRPKNKANQACPFGKLKAGSEQRRMEPIAGHWLEILNKAGGEKFLSLAVFAGEGNIDADPLRAVCGRL